MKRFVLFLMVVSAVAGCVHTNRPAMSPAVAASCRSASVRWFAPEGEHERARLDTWCAGVGEPVLQSAAAAPTEAPIDLAEVMFVSWNVHVGNGDIAAFVRDLRDGSFTSGRPVHHFVLMLQEAVRTSDVPPFRPEAAGAARISAYDRQSIDIVDINRELGTHLLYVPSMRNGNSPDDGPADRGSAILSTIPLFEPMAVELPGERQRRVVVVAKLALPPMISGVSGTRQAVSVGVIHLDALGAANRLWLFGTSWMRALQVKSIEALLPSGNLVLGADLNTWHGTSEPAARYMTQLFAATPVAVNRNGLGLRVLDYMFFRTGENRRAYYEVVPKAYGSDHRPLVGRFQ
jgi:hypothetical protein